MSPFLFSALLLHAASSASAHKSGYEPTSLVRLMVAPEKYGNKDVAISGVAREHSQGIWVLYMDCESAKAEITLNGVSFRPSDEVAASPVAAQMNMRYVLVQGRFAGRSALPRTFSGSFEDVDQVTVYPLFHELTDSGEVVDKNSDVCGK